MVVISSQPGGGSEPNDCRDIKQVYVAGWKMGRSADSRSIYTGSKTELRDSEPGLGAGKPSGHCSQSQGHEVPSPSQPCLHPLSSVHPNGPERSSPEFQSRCV